MQRRRVNPLDTIATSSGTTVLLGAAAVIASLLAPGADWLMTCLWLVMAAAMLPVTRHYNLSMSNSPIACAMFMMLQAAMTPVDDTPLQSWLLAATCLAGSALLFSGFQAQKSTRSLFTLTLMAGTGMVFSWSYLPMAVAFLAGSIQMRSLSLRGLVAMALGLVTGPLLIYGFGLKTPSMPQLPLAATDMAANLHLYASAGFSAVCSLVFGGCCVLTSYGYQARLRAFNAFIYVVTVTTIAMAAADTGNIGLYLAPLNLCAAYHIGHFSVSRSRGWIAVTVATLAIAALYVWNSWI